MTEKIRNYIHQHHMITAGDTVCVGLSGGADSVCLLFVLLELYGPAQLMAVHVNHQLRGEAADADEQFVREICEKQRVPLFVYRYPVADIAAENGTGTEEAGRLVRREAYRDCLEKHGASVIALAHHANDRAETFLFHASRGTSLAGLAGIRAVQPLLLPGRLKGREEAERPAAVIRPLLCVTREEIEAWLAEKGLAWRTDETNRDEHYSRNAIRHTVIPYLEDRINRQAVSHIAEVSADLEEADRFLRGEAERRAARYVQQTEKEIRVRAALEEEPSVMQGYILLGALEEAGGSRKDLGREQVRQLQELFRLRTGKRIDLPYGLCAVRDEDGLQIFRREENGEGEGRNLPDPVRIEGEGTYCWNGWQFRVKILEGPAAEKTEGRSGYIDGIPRKKYTKWLDCDKIDGTLCIRSRRDGDRLIVNAQGGSRKLKDYMIDEKVPREERDGIPLLAYGGQVCWVVGHRISEEIKVTEKTRRIMEITAEWIAAAGEDGTV